MYKVQLLLLLLINSSLKSVAQIDSIQLNYAQVQKLSQLPLHCIMQEYPNKLNQVLTDSTFLDSPKKLHPVFYGCFDWHSAVHGHWLLAKALNLFPESDLAQEIELLFDQQFTSEKVQTELDYFSPKLEKSFERTYGWAWLLKLHEELSKVKSEKKLKWIQNLQPLTDFIRDSYLNFLPKLVYPVRTGEHPNTAFGLSLALDYAVQIRDTVLQQAINISARNYFIDDCDCPLNYEPGGFDFLSPCLQEAELMSKVLNEIEFEKWLKKFLPGITSKKFKLDPGKVIDRTDGKLVHLDGLNFSRAWCFYQLSIKLPGHRSHFISLGDAQLNASINFVTESDYMGSHWLATFLFFAMDKRADTILNDM